MAERCPTCGAYREPSALDRFVTYAQDVAPKSFSTFDVAAHVGTTRGTAHNTLSRLVAVGRLKRVSHGRYAIGDSDSEVTNG